MHFIFSEIFRFLIEKSTASSWDLIIILWFVSELRIVCKILSWVMHHWIIPSSWTRQPITLKPIIVAAIQLFCSVCSCIVRLIIEIFKFLATLESLISCRFIVWISRWSTASSSSIDVTGWRELIFLWFLAVAACRTVVAHDKERIIIEEVVMSLEFNNPFFFFDFYQPIFVMFSLLFCFLFFWFLINYSIYLTVSLSFSFSHLGSHNKYLLLLSNFHYQPSAAA